jgi:hypothetical protein
MGLVDLDLSVITSVGSFLAGAGTLAALAWGVFQWFKARRSATIEQVRAHIIAARYELVVRTTEFQSLVFQITKRIFDPNNPVAFQLAQKIVKVAQQDSKVVIEDPLKDVDDSILHGWILYSLTPDLINLDNTIPLQVLSKIELLRGTLPVLHKYLETVAKICLVAHKRELSVKTIRKYLRTTAQAVLEMWNRREDFFTDGKIDENRVLMAWRGLLANAMFHVRDSTTHIDVHNLALFKLLDPMVDHYLEQSDSALWQMIKEETSYNMEQFHDKDWDEILREILEWRPGKRNPKLSTELANNLGALVNMIKGP